MTLEQRLVFQRAFREVLRPIQPEELEAWSQILWMQFVVECVDHETVTPAIRVAYPLVCAQCAATMCLSTGMQPESALALIEDYVTEYFSN
jgi:hypothetical protein